MHYNLRATRQLVVAIVLTHLSGCGGESPMCQLDLPCGPHGEALCPVDVPCSLVPPRPGFDVEFLAGQNLVDLTADFGSVEVIVRMGGAVETNAAGEEEEPGGGDPLPFVDICRSGTTMRFRTYESEWVPFKTTPGVTTLTGFGTSNPEVPSTVHEWQDPPFAELGVAPQIASTAHVRLESEYECGDRFWVGALVKATEVERADDLDCEPTRPPSPDSRFVARGPWKQVTLECEADEFLETQRVSLDDGEFRIVGSTED